MSLFFRFDELFWGYTNIVATDFFTSNNLIQIAKESNLRRGKLKQCESLKTEKDRLACKNICIGDDCHCASRCLCHGNADNMTIKNVTEMIKNQDITACFLCCTRCSIKLVGTNK